MQLFPLSRFLYQIVHRIIQKICNDRGCFLSTPKAPAVPAPPAIAPSPVPTETSPDATLQGRQRAISMLKFGALSTVANAGGAAGITGQGSDLAGVYPSMAQGKQTIGGQ